MACFMGWKVAVAVWGIFFLMVILTRFVSLGSVGARVLYPISIKGWCTRTCGIPSGTGGWWAAGVAA